MIGGWIRNVLLVLVIALWRWSTLDFNTRYFEFIYPGSSASHILYFLVVPVVVILASLYALLRRWRKSFSGRDVALVGWPILFFPVHLLPMQ